MVVSLGIAQRYSMTLEIIPFHSLLNSKISLESTHSQYPSIEKAWTISGDHKSDFLSAAKPMFLSSNLSTIEVAMFLIKSWLTLFENSTDKIPFTDGLLISPPLNQNFHPFLKKTLLSPSLVLRAFSQKHLVPKESRHWVNAISHL